MAASVVGDDAVAMFGQEEHLVFERVCAKRPAMAENDRLTPTPILVVDLGAVLGGHQTHGQSFQMGCGNTLCFRTRIGADISRLLRTAALLVKLQSTPRRAGNRSAAG